MGGLIGQGHSNGSCRRVGRGRFPPRHFTMAFASPFPSTLTHLDMRMQHEWQVCAREERCAARERTLHRWFEVQCIITQRHSEQVRRLEVWLGCCLIDYLRHHMCVERTQHTHMMHDEYANENQCGICSQV